MHGAGGFICRQGTEPVDQDQGGGGGGSVSGGVGEYVCFDAKGVPTPNRDSNLLFAPHYQCRFFCSRVPVRVREEDWY